MEDSILSLKNIYKTYSGAGLDVPVLKDISFEVKKGEFAAIMGPSGSGKSTLMNIIGCLDHQTTGSYELNHRNVAEMNDDELADLRNTEIGFVFQNFNLLPNESALENVELPLLYAGVPLEERKQRAEAALKEVGLEERMSFDPSRLSGGQKQRVAVARAMVNRPSLLLADEPTGALDSKSGEALMELFLKLNRELGMTIVMITHELSVAEYADRIYDLRDGQLSDHVPGGDS